MKYQTPYQLTNRFGAALLVEEGDRSKLCCRVSVAFRFLLSSSVSSSSSFEGGEGVVDCCVNTGETAVR